MQAHIDAINSTGGINGHPVKLVVCSDQGDANQARTCANDAASNSNIVATVFTFSSWDDTIDPIVVQAGLPQIAVDPQGANDLSTCTVCFAFWGGGITDSVGAATLLHTYDNVNKVNYAFINVPVAQTEVGYGKQTFLQIVPNGSVTVQYIPPTAADMSQYVEASKSAEGVAIVLPPAQLISFLNTAKSLGITTKYSTLGVFITPTLLQQGGQLLDGAVVAQDTAPPTSDVAGAKEYRADIAKYAPAGTATNDQTALDGWIAVKAFGDVAKTIKGSVTRASVLAAMNSLKNYTGLGGLIPPFSTDVKFTGLGGVAPRLLNPTLYPVRLQNGVEVSLSPDFYNPFTGKSVPAS
jgi:branched-chain amino acid transport system substrate-binding protein